MISIIVPILNNEIYVDRCIQSILNQTYRDFELLLMVGMCRDKSLEKCIEWQRRDERIIIVSRKDNSLGDARNYALPMAKGEFIAYIDADDCVEKDYLEKLVRPLKQFKDIDFSACGYDRYNENEIMNVSLPNKEGIQEIDFSRYFDLNIFVTVWVKLYRKKFLLDNGIVMFDGLCEDESHQVMIASTANKIYIVREALYHYNIGNINSLITARTLEARLDYVSSMEFAIDYMKKINVYEANREVLKLRICNALQNNLTIFKYKENMAKLYTEFVKKYFHEMHSKIRFAPVKLEDKNIIMFGAGKYAKVALDKLPKEINVRYIVDSNPKIVGKDLGGIVIEPIEKLMDEDRETPILISTLKYSFEVFLKLKNDGFSQIYYLYDVL